MYMCVKLFPRNLNLGFYTPSPTNTYTCGVTISLRMCSRISTHLYYSDTNLLYLIMQIDENTL